MVKFVFIFGVKQDSVPLLEHKILRMKQTSLKFVIKLDGYRSYK